MFVGTVINAMINSTVDMILEDRKRVKENRKKIIQDEVDKLTNPKNVHHFDRDTKRTLQTLKLLFSGRSILEDRLKLSTMIVHTYFFATEMNYFHNFYVWLVDFCETIVENTFFQNFVTFVILIASAQVGLQTDASLSLKLAPVISVLDKLILTVFTFEVVVKVIAEGHTFWAYFNNSWNKFDFFIILACYLPTGSRNLVMMLRLLRLMRVLKLLRAFPKLQTIVIAILNSLTSIFYIGVLLIIFFYFYAIVGISLFGVNDPWRFGNLHMAMVTLFQSSTFDSWTPVALTQVYGCNTPTWVYGDWFSGCNNPSGSFLLGFIYFYTFAVIGGLILLALFIGVVNVYMDIAGQDMERERETELKVLDFAAAKGLDHYIINLYRESFSVIDFSKSGFIGIVEVRVGLNIAGNQMSDEEWQKLVDDIEVNHGGKYNFYDFVKFIFRLKTDYLDRKKRCKNAVDENPKPVSLNIIVDNQSDAQNSQIIEVRDKGNFNPTKRILMNGYQRIAPELKACGDSGEQVSIKSKIKPIPPSTLSPTKLIEIRQQRLFEEKQEEKHSETLTDKKQNSIAFSEKARSKPKAPQSTSPQKILEIRRMNSERQILDKVNLEKLVEYDRTEITTASSPPDFSRPYANNRAVRSNCTFTGTTSAVSSANLYGKALFSSGLIADAKFHGHINFNIPSKDSIIFFVMMFCNSFLYVITTVLN